MSRKNGGIIGPANTPVGGLITGLAGGVWRMNDVANFVGNSQWPKVPENIDNSLRFDDGSTDYLRRTPSSAGNRRTFTFSTWIKRSALGSINRSIICANVDTANKTMLRFTDSDEIRFVRFTTGGATNQLITNAKFRDVSAWYHIVLAVDTTNSTAGDRLRLYVNGSEITSFSTESQPTQNYDYDINNTEEHNIGLGTDTDTHLFDGYMAEVVLIDGQQLDPTSFGEFDTTTGIWKPKKIGQIANAGTNSFYLDFKDSSNVGKDASGLSNNFTVNNLTSIDQSTDTCVVNFATINPLTPATATLSEGNLKFANSATNHKGVVGTFGASSGKWYCEIKTTDVSDSTHVGIIDIDQQSDTPGNTIGYSSRGYSLSNERDVYNNNGILSGYTDWSGTYGDGDILGIAMDLDNNKLYFSKGGQWSNGSGAWDSTTFNASTGAIPITAGYTYTFGASVYNGNNEFNFGNPPFSISSGNSDANGFGNFEYPVPSGYYALNTSNLNTYG
jgi:hypothetical protein